MPKEIVNLNNPENFTVLSGLARPLDQKGWSRFYLTPRGQPKSVVFVFDSVSRALLYELQPGTAVSLWKSLGDEFISRIEYEAYAISDQAKNFRFQTEFVFGDAKIPDATLDVRISVSQPDDVAISVAEGGDPAKELCWAVKSHLDRVFTEIQFEDIDSLQQFADGVHSAVRSTRIDHPYLVLEHTTIQYSLPKSIEEAFEEIQEERVKRKTIIEKSKREYAETEQKRRIEKLSRETQLEIDELELERLGITDARIRLLMRDPEKRAQYLEELYKHQMDLLRHSQAQDKELIDMKLETIRRFRDRVLDESSDIKDLQQLLNLVGQTVLPTSERHILSTVVPGGLAAIPQLEDKTFREEGALPSDEESQESEEPTSSTTPEALEQEEEASPPVKPKRRRRRPRSLTRSTQIAQDAETEESATDGDEESDS